MSNKEVSDFKSQKLTTKTTYFKPLLKDVNDNI